MHNHSRQGRRESAPVDRAPMRNVIAAALLLLALGGCSATKVAVPADFPRPVMQPLPADVGLVLGDKLTTWVHREPPQGDPRWQLSLGEAHAALFTNLFTGMFRSVRVIGPDAPPPPGVDLLIRPTVVEMELGVPAYLGGEFFQLWATYKMAVTDTNGKPVAAWTVEAYGRSPDPLLGDDEALRAAAVAALRDAAAVVAVMLPRNQAIRAALYPQSQPPAMPMVPAPGETALNHPDPDAPTI